jgi:hypothetical protein
MPKFTEAEKEFWTMVMHWANDGERVLKCNICKKKIKAKTRKGHDHFFGNTHPDNNIYEIFSPIPIPMTELVVDPKTGVPLPQEIKQNG